MSVWYGYTHMQWHHRTCLRVYRNSMIVCYSYTRSRFYGYETTRIPNYPLMPAYRYHMRWVFYQKLLDGACVHTTELPYHHTRTRPHPHSMIRTCRYTITRYYTSTTVSFYEPTTKSFIPDTNNLTYGHTLALALHCILQQVRTCTSIRLYTGGIAQLDISRITHWKRSVGVILYVRAAVRSHCGTCVVLRYCTMWGLHFCIMCSAARTR